ncbi:glycosyltransferase family 4 protein [Caulobacter sp. FWC26]|jgi:glycosyltransferase involved in cell wall biosynthesis|uniref:glycosyltransferase family 4 protein n=1 Tax=Caulobacter sp. FWC26 TaxID=69665 RepID=UPI001FEEC61C|nr:glycosyltransferase family 4 protein [Caulobacter sp. FWC26]
MAELRIAYVINSVEGGGAALPVPAVARALIAQGARLEVFALTRRDGRAVAAMEAAGLTVHVRQGGEKDHRKTLAWLDARLRDWRPDVIWTSLTRATLLGQIVGERLGVPVVSWQHAAKLKLANLLLLRLRQARSRLWVGDSHSVTDLTAERLEVPPSRLVAWPLFAANPDMYRAYPWRPGQTLELGSLGRLHPVKGYDILIEALLRLQTQGCCFPAAIRVRIAGEGRARAALEERAERHGLTFIEFTGFNERPLEFLADLHLYLQPSRSEGLCIAAHEAMQAGLPVIASSVGELPYSIENGVTGLTVPPGDPWALAEALGRLLSRPERLAQMGAAARTRVLERFGQDAFDRTGAAIYQRLPGFIAETGRAPDRASRPLPNPGGRPCAS